jgi:DNA-binding protein HU-beta
MAKKAKKAKKASRTTLRSSKGKKLYAVRDAGGQFEDIQSYKKAQGQDMKRTSTGERAKKTAKKKKSS